MSEESAWAQVDESRACEGYDTEEPCMCGTDFTCMADGHDQAIVRIQQQRINETTEDIRPDRHLSDAAGTARRDSLVIRLDLT